LIAGSGNIVSPHATAEAVMPAILFLSGAMILVALSFAVLGVETHGVPMALDSDEGIPAGGRAEARQRAT
jgi:putative MFS transporter